MPKRVDPVGMVEVSVNTEELAEDCLCVIEEGFWETRVLSNPVATRKRGKRRCESRGAHRDRSSRAWGIGTGRGENSWRAGDRINGEGARVTELANDPALHKIDILGCRDFDRILVTIQPGVGVGT